VKAEVYNKLKPVPKTHDKPFVNGVKTPIQDTDENLQRYCAYREHILQGTKSCSLRKMSAGRPTPNVIVDIVRAMMVRNWYERPNPLCERVRKRVRNVREPLLQRIEIQPHE
jgi:hypothetical protein